MLDVMIWWVINVAKSRIQSGVDLWLRLGNPRWHVWCVIELPWVVQNVIRDGYLMGSSSVSNPWALVAASAGDGDTGMRGEVGLAARSVM